MPVTADVILHTPFESLAQAAAASEEAGQDEPEDGEAQPMATDVGPNSEAAEAAVQPGRSAAQSTILSRLLEELIHHSKPEVKSSVHQHSTMRFGSTAKVLLKCKLKYYRISECTGP